VPGRRTAKSKSGSRSGLARFKSLTPAWPAPRAVERFRDRARSQESAPPPSWRQAEQSHQLLPSGQFRGRGAGQHDQPRRCAVPALQLPEPVACPAEIAAYGIRRRSCVADGGAVGPVGGQAGANAVLADRRAHQSLQQHAQRSARGGDGCRLISRVVQEEPEPVMDVVPPPDQLPRGRIHPLLRRHQHGPDRIRKIRQPPVLREIAGIEGIGVGKVRPAARGDMDAGGSFGMEGGHNRFVFRGGSVRGLAAQAGGVIIPDHV